MTSPHQPAGLAHLYALDSLEDDELRSFESHLETCVTCTAEVTRAQEVAGALVPDAAVPPALWGRVVAVSGASPKDDARTPQLSRWLAGVAAVVVLGLGILAVWQQARIQQLDGEGQLVTAAAAAVEDGALEDFFVVGGEVVARVVLDRDGAGYFIPENLAPLDPNRTYQLWLTTADGLVISAGAFGSDPIPGRFTWTGEVTGYALTREVAGGVVSSAGDVVATIET